MVTTFHEMDNFETKLQKYYQKEILGISGRMVPSELNPVYIWSLFKLFYKNYISSKSKNKQSGSRVHSCFLTFIIFVFLFGNLVTLLLYLVEVIKLRFLSYQ